MYNHIFVKIWCLIRGQRLRKPQCDAHVGFSISVLYELTSVCFVTYPQFCIGTKYPTSTFPSKIQDHPSGVVGMMVAGGSVGFGSGYGSLNSLERSWSSLVNLLLKCFIWLHAGLGIFSGENKKIFPISELHHLIYMNFQWPWHFDFPPFFT